MTAEEVCKKYGCSLSSLQTNYKRTAASILKKYGIKLVKIKKAGQVYYVAMEDDKRALTIFNENRELFYVDDDTLTLVDWEFNIFLAILVSPMTVFNGSYEEMLDYINHRRSKDNEQKVKAALESLAAKDYIMYLVDKTDNNYFMAGLYKKVREKMRVEIDMIRRSKEIAEKYHKQNWGYILKVWAAVKFLTEEIEKGNRDYYKVADISIMTGLSEKQIRDINKLLKNSDIYRTDYLYADTRTRVGTIATLNEFYNSKIIMPEDDEELF